MSRQITDPKSLKSRPYVPKPAKAPRFRRCKLPKRALKLAEAGATLYDIALELNCAERTVSRWRLKYENFREALDRGRAEEDARRAAYKAAADEAYEPQRIKNARMYRLPPRALAPAAARKSARKAALEVTRLLDITALLDGHATPPAEPARRVEAVPGALDANAADEAARRMAERRAARGQSPAEPEEPRGWQDGAGDPVELYDPRSEW